MVDRLTVLFLKFLEYFHKLQLFIWWLLEIHIIKIVSCYIVLVSIKEVGAIQKRRRRCMNEPRAFLPSHFMGFLMSPSLQVSLLNYVFLVSWAFALPYSHYRPLASSVCTVWTCVIIICKMLYQLKSINPSSYSKICSLVNTSLHRAPSFATDICVRGHDSTAEIFHKCFPFTARKLLK